MGKENPKERVGFGPRGIFPQHHLHAEGWEEDSAERRKSGNLEDGGNLSITVSPHPIGVWLCEGKAETIGARELRRVAPAFNLRQFTKRGRLLHFSALYDRRDACVRRSARANDQPAEQTTTWCRVSVPMPKTP